MELQIHPSAVIHKDAELADGVKVGPNCVIDSGVSIGTGTILEPNVVISKDVKIGENNHFFPNCVIGCRPQTLNLSLDDEIGRLVIGDGNVIHEQVTIHPGMHQGTQTTIGNNNFIMVGAHIGHDCTLGDKIVMSNLVQIGGHCKIDNGAWFSGLSGAHQFVTIGKWCYIAGLAGITRDILDAYKKLYRKTGSLLENAKALALENGLDENVKAIIDSITKSSKHQYGRYLETFR